MAKQEAMQKQLRKLLNDKPGKRGGPKDSDDPNAGMGDSDEDSEGLGGMGGPNDFFNKKKKSYSIPKVTLSFKEDDLAKEQDDVR